MMRSWAAGQSGDPKAPKEYARAGGDGGGATGGADGGGATGGGVVGTAKREHTAARSMLNGPAGSESVLR